jgi:hypothetical protein
MEIESSLPCSQQPTIFPNPEPDQSTPCTSTLPSCPLYHVAPPNHRVYLTCPPLVSHAQSILFFLIRSPANYLFGFESRSCASRIFLQSPLISYFRGQNASLCTPSSITLSICSDLNVTGQVSRGHKAENKIE